MGTPDGSTIMMEDERGYAKALFHIPSDETQDPKNWDGKKTTITQLAIAQRLVSTIETEAALHKNGIFQS